MSEKAVEQAPEELEVLENMSTDQALVATGEDAVEAEAGAQSELDGSEDVPASDSDDAESVSEDAVEADEAEEDGPAEVVRPDGTAWYVVHSYSGYENKVKKNLEHRIVSMGMQDRIFQVVVPTEEEVELRDGQRRTTERRVFPGYILVEMLMDDDTWYVVRNTPGVTDFVRTGEKPVPLRDEEVDRIIRRMEAEAPRIKVSFRPGQKVRITEGPFEDFMGTVDVIDTDHARVRVLVSMFGRETPVEVDFLQVERV